MAAGRGTPLLIKRRTIGTIAHSQMGKIMPKPAATKTAALVRSARNSLDELRRNESLDHSADHRTHHHEGCGFQYDGDKVDSEIADHRVSSDHSRSEHN